MEGLFIKAKFKQYESEIKELRAQLKEQALVIEKLSEINKKQQDLLNKYINLVEV